MGCRRCGGAAGVPAPFPALEVGLFPLPLLIATGKAWHSMAPEEQWGEMDRGESLLGSVNLPGLHSAK